MAPTTTGRRAEFVDDLVVSQVRHGGNRPTHRQRAPESWARNVGSEAQHVRAVGSASNGLDALGLQVTVVHRQPYPMNRQLDPQAGALLQQQLQRRGIRFALGASPVAVGSLQGAVASVRLDDGRSLPARLVVFAAGIAPNVEVAAAAGVPCGRAIRVDRWLRTGMPGIHALGECCELEGRGFGLVAPVWRQARVLAEVLTGQAGAGFAHVEDPVQLKVSGVELFSAGAMPFAADAESQVLQDPARGIYRRLVFAGGRLVGAILLGDRRGGSWYGELIAAGQDVSALRPRLMFGRERIPDGLDRNSGLELRDPPD